MQCIKTYPQASTQTCEPPSLIMASASVQSRLQALDDSSSSTSNKSAEYQSLLDDILSQSPPEELPHNLSAFISAALRETLGIVAARPLLTASVDALRRLPSPEARIAVGTHALAALAPRVASFEDQDGAVRAVLADAYTATEEYAAAARVLAAQRLDTATRHASDRDKVAAWVRICRLYLEDDDATHAEQYLNRAKQLAFRVDEARDPELALAFQLSQARILDARRRFAEASAAYHAVSRAGALADEERAAALRQALVCAVLAPAGPQRARLLGTLHRDERAAALDDFAVLDAVFRDRLLRPAEVEAFRARLAPHQLARTADGSTVLAAAVSEHNLRAASRLYRNLGTRELGTLLGLEPARAERYAARMLEQGRLAGHIDQIEGVVFFEDPEVGAAPAGAAGAGGSEHGALRQWDRNVQALVEDVERVTTLLQTEVPVSAVRTIPSVPG